MSNKLIQKLQKQINTQQQTNQNALIQQQMANAQSLQKTIDNVQDNIACGKGTQCYFQKHSAELESLFKEKQINKSTATKQLDTARKNYYVFTDGESGFRKEENDRLSLIADKIINTLTESHQDTVDAINTSIGKYDYAGKYQTQLISKLNRLFKDDDALKKKISDEISGLKTADRKVYYENNEIKTVELWVKVLTVLYWLIFAIYLGLFIIRSLWKDKIYIAILIVLILWPFISDWITGKIIFVIQKIIGLFPKNVYVNANNM